MPHFCKDWYLYCDTAVGDKMVPYDPKCRLSADPGLSRQEAIDSAKAAGWLVNRKIALCPHCRKKVGK